MRKLLSVIGLHTRAPGKCENQLSSLSGRALRSPCTFATPPLKSKKEKNTAPTKTRFWLAKTFVLENMGEQHNIYEQLWLSCECGDFPLAESLRVWLAKPGDRKALPLKEENMVDRFDGARAVHWDYSNFMKAFYQNPLQTMRKSCIIIKTKPF